MKILFQRFFSPSNDKRQKKKESRDDLRVSWQPMNLMWQVDWLFHLPRRMRAKDLHVHGTYNN